MQASTAVSTAATSSSNPASRPYRPVRFSYSAKRSFRLARRRAYEHGQTWYRGQLHTSLSLQATYGQPVSNQRVKSDRPQSTCPRLQCITWNAGGLTATSWQALQLWLSALHVDIVAVQETHWSFEGVFNIPGWVCVHSGKTDQDRFAGVMLMISDARASAQDVRYRSLIAGRVLHVRVPLAHAAVDAFCVYQHVWRTSATKDDNMRCRANIWEAIASGLETTPMRNLLVLMGDLNTRPPACAGVGTAIPNAPLKTEPDQHKLAKLLHRHSLIALNTWSQATPHTHAHLGYKTLIDYIIVRRTQADGVARQSGPNHESRLNSHKSEGHSPVLASLRLPQPWVFSRSHSEHRIDITALKNAARLKTPRLEAFQQALHEAVNSLNHEVHPDELHSSLNNTLISTGRIWFPKTREASADGSKFPTLKAVDSDMQISLRQLWQLRDRLRSFTDRTCPRSLFQAWRLALSIICSNDSFISLVDDGRQPDGQI